MTFDNASDPIFLVRNILLLFKHAHQNRKQCISHLKTGCSGIFESVQNQHFYLRNQF